MILCKTTDYSHKQSLLVFINCDADHAFLHIFCKIQYVAVGYVNFKFDMLLR